MNNQMGEEEKAKRENLIRQAIEHQKMTFQAMQGAEMPEWLGSEMTMPQFKILFLTYTHGRVRMSGIAEALGKNISTATGVVDRLVEQKLIRREEDPDDRRVVFIRLTDEGMHFCESLLQAGWGDAFNVFNRLTTEELELVERAMQLVSQAAIDQANERMAKHDRRWADYQSLRERFHQNPKQ